MLIRLPCLIEVSIRLGPFSDCTSNQVRSVLRKNQNAIVKVNVEIAKR